METSKTDLTKILSVSGRHGLYKYIAQSRNGAIVESLDTGERTAFGLKSRITTLADISIYTENGELKLQDVLLKMKEVLGNSAAPEQKASPEDFKALFAKAVPDYDPDRFYVSHMKKISQWYNEILNHASFDFTVPEEEASSEDSPAEDGAPSENTTE